MKSRKIQFITTIINANTKDVYGCTIRYAAGTRAYLRWLGITVSQSFLYAFDKRPKASKEFLVEPAFYANLGNEEEYADVCSRTHQNDYAIHIKLEPVERYTTTVNLTVNGLPMHLAPKLGETIKVVAPSGTTFLTAKNKLPQHLSEIHT